MVSECGLRKIKCCTPFTWRRTHCWGRRNVLKILCFRHGDGWCTLSYICNILVYVCTVHCDVAYPPKRLLYSHILLHIRYTCLISSLACRHTTNKVFFDLPTVNDGLCICTLEWRLPNISFTGCSKVPHNKVTGSHCLLQTSERSCYRQVDHYAALGDVPCQ